jgi:lactate 2-monooxygenase
MSNPNDTSNSNAQPGRPPYAQYQVEIYAKAILTGERVPTTTDPAKLEDQARSAMSAEGFGYVFGGAGEQATMHANRLAFRRFKLVPHMLRPTVPRDLKVTLFGNTYGIISPLWSPPPRILV